MSVIQKIREKYAAVSIAVIALSLIGFILMDALSSRSSLFGANSTIIGEVNGEDISFQEFDTELSDMENNYRQQGMQVDENMRQQLIEMLWNNKVDEVLMEKEYDKLGLVFSAADLNEALYGENPPPALAQQFKNEKTGAYDSEAARKFINGLRKKKANDPQRQFVEKNLISYLISSGIKNKYSTLLSGSVFYPKWLHELENKNENSFISFSYVNIPYTTINDSTIQVTDEEINAYVKKHPKQYKQEKSRSISYAVFNAAPSAADSITVRNALLTQLENFKSATDNEQFLNANGSALSYNDGYVLSSKLQVPNADSIKALADGATYGPYQDASNFVIAKMIAKRNLPDSVKCRHILIATKDAQSGQVTLADTVAKKRADSIAAAIASGSDFATLAKQFSSDPGSKDKGGEYEFSSQQFSSLAKPFAEFIFYKPVSSKEVVKTDFGWHYIEVLEQKKFETAYKVAYFAKTIEAGNETVNAASTAATQFAAITRDVAGFEKNCAQQKITPATADIKPNEFSITGLGAARRLIKWVYENKEGTVSEPETIGDKYIVAVITKIKEEGLMDAATAKASVEPLLKTKKKAKQITDKIGNKRDLNAIAQSFSISVLKADSVTFASPFISNIGSDPLVLGAAFNPTQFQKVSNPLAGNSGVFLIKPEQKGMKSSQNLDYIAKRNQTEQGLKGSLSYRSSESLKKSADIDDSRIKFY
ncbi:MAG: SurA N-terminal domain-containing protein [Bacteroidetes bacterium]|nr:SurA N-terminal domain-containing protein [Bacteroidota bacterium]